VSVKLDTAAITRRMIFPDRVFGMSGGGTTRRSSAGDLADLDLDGPGDLVDHLLVGLESRLQRHIHLDGAAPDVIDHRDGGGLGHLGHGQCGRLDLLVPAGARPR